MSSSSNNFWDSLAKKYLKPDSFVLDCGCATGLYSFVFSKYVKHIQAFDTSYEMIAVALNRNKEKRVENITFTQTNIFDTKYEEGSLDIILAFNILLYMEDIESALSRMYNLLKQTGLLITSTACLKEKSSFIAILSSLMIYLLIRLGILPNLKFLSAEELEKTISEAGFSLVHASVLIDKPVIEYYIVGQKGN